MQKTQESAETLGLQVLGWLVADEDLMPVFQGSTGVSEADIRARAADPQFLGAVLDFLMMDDAWVIRFCDAHSVPYERIMQARAALPGGEQVNWT
ncbi:DUF3572 domain-containing protein [Sulfitobacter geojensis]|jgi:hypothetical protein|uniref:DUF3572 domain-containing protein n=1 Tax=Sulfitobacter geojensis TaxID=1342299 RepID=A0AAE3B4P7_9RHOB|nr:DUF3572 domain-containing protein [Sulfitobacter geojensis]KHA52939.1 DUF3572 domain containing protein [Sulfitobacter geojensis]MBM1687738.1 DUF3572 domain-containing protein [Sulfitobacter geojensis]MBM1691805.1 DUF3572 domain-containing protein [Sulfitobacter geojensis]MBM1703971.1 DUF3572 domain-containing protein [Sulfitobacter geojensis]MBM1708029.1 DUF3572 domain-containing protein [Sulfitobacter geojensis]